MLDTNDPIFSLTARREIAATAIEERRATEARHVRVLARILAEERVRQAQENVAAHEDARPSRLPTSALSRRPSWWTRLTNVRPPIALITKTEGDGERRRWVDLAKERLARLLSSDAPTALQYADQVAAAIEAPGAEPSRPRRRGREAAESLATDGIGGR